jgi:hypothetical protein
MEPVFQTIVPLLDDPEVQVHTLHFFVDGQNLVEAHREVHLVLESLIPFHAIKPNFKHLSWFAVL